MLTPCVCPVAGWCETHGRKMSEGLHRACRERPGYFEALQKPKPPTKIRGIGDVVKIAADVTGASLVAKAYEKVTGRPCGCGDRQKKMNEMFPFGSPLQEVEDPVVSDEAAVDQGPHELPKP
jgi:hypothetical protein